MLRKFICCGIACCTMFTLVNHVNTSVAFAQEASEATFETKATETLGATLVAYALNAHINVGLLIDGYEGEAVEQERVNTLLDLNINLLDQIGPAVIELSKFDECSEADKDVLTKLAKSFKSIKAEAVAAKKYVESSEEADLATFQEKNQAAQTELDTLLK